jgi:LL-diaminopimelate aminotransferase
VGWEKSSRLRSLPPYLFSEIDRKKKALLAAGKDVINLGVGDPDMPTPQFIRDAMRQAIDEPAFHRYPLDEGLLEYREAIARYYKRRWDVTLDPATEIYPVIGSKEAIFHFPLAVLNAGDVALIPEPGYPPYRSGTVFSDGVPHLLPLRKENGFLPELPSIEKSVLARARILWINYPNNPTGAVASRGWLQDAVDFARRHGLVLASDAAYCETWYESRPPCLFQLDGGLECGIEFHSLSKTFNMTGWRIGWAAGNRELIAALAAIKSNADSGQFMALQKTAAVALDRGDEEAARIRETYRRRRDAFVDAMRKAGLAAAKMPATFYQWTPVPGKMKSVEFITLLLEKANVVTTPGIGFGPSGEGFFRVALTQSEERIREACERIARAIS